MSRLWQDLRYALRLFERSPGFAAVAGMTLALGIGANTAVFSVVDAVLLRPLAFRDPGQLVSLKDDLRGFNIPSIGISILELEDFRDRSGVFEEISAEWPISGNLTGGDRPERVEAMVVSPGYFHMLGVNAALGRTFGLQDSAAGFAETVVLSDAAWRRIFGADPQVLGRKLRLDNDAYAIVGVMPPDFRHPGPTIQGDVEMWITSEFRAGPFSNQPKRNQRMIPGAIGRLKPGMSVAQAQARLESFAAELRQRFAADYPSAAKWTPHVTGLQEDLVGNVRPMLVIILGAVGFVLLICCVSVANLLLARATSRQRELAVRRALGAMPGDLIRQLVTENLLLASASGAAGLLLFVWFRPALMSLAPETLPRLNEAGLNAGVLAFAFGLSLLTGILFGLAPAIQTAGINLIANLKDGSRGTSGGRAQNRTRSILVACEIAFSLMLMAGAGLLLKSFWNLLQVDPGFHAKQVLVANTWLPAPNNPELAPYRTPAKRSALIRNIMDRVHRLPGVEYVAMGGGQSIPLTGWNTIPVGIEGRSDTAGGAPVAQVTSVSPDFFQVLGVRLIKGRVFSESDDGANRVALVDQTMERRFWPHDTAVGKRIRAGQFNTAWWTVIGVVSNMKTDAFDKPPSPHVYFSIYQQGTYALSLFVRASGDPGNLGEALRREVRAIDPELPVFGIRSMDEVVARSLAQRRFALEVIGAFALVALLLAGLGIYGVTAFAVSQRTQEIGIRMALGAGRGHVLRMVLGQGMALTAFGLAGGLAGAFLLTRFLRSLLFGADPADPGTYLAISVVLTVASLFACYIPARRAMRVDAAVALRWE